MKDNKLPISKKKNFVFTVILVLLTLFFCSMLYFATIIWRSASFYTKHIRWTSSVYRFDNNYGYFPKPYELAYHSLKYGEQVPVIFDDKGFRIPYSEEKKQAVSSKSIILFLGDSYTHGYGVPSEKSFAYLTAQGLNSSALNAGASGWGLPQMVLRATEVIPTIKPDIVVAQYSNWLPERALNVYSQSNMGKPSVPYLYEINGSVAIHPPVFESANFKLPVLEFAKKGFFTFFRNIALPLLIKDDYLIYSIKLKLFLGQLNPPIKSRQKAVDFAYSEIERLCNANNAKMIIAVLPRTIDDYPEDNLSVFSNHLVDTLKPLKEKLSEPTQQNWSKTYRFWRGNPPVMVDSHPNVHMHEEIAKILIAHIKQK